MNFTTDVKRINGGRILDALRTDDGRYLVQVKKGSRAFWCQVNRDLYRSALAVI
jgi:hypothetical protein